MSLHPDLLAALAVIPETERTVRLRGHDVVFHPIEVRHYVQLALTDPQTAMSSFGVDLETGKKATPEQISKSREHMSDETVGKLLALSTREPEFEKLAANLTAAEKARCLAAAFAVTTGGDVAGFFEAVRVHLEMTLALITTQQNAQSSTSAKGGGSGSGIRSSSSSASSRGSRRK